MQIGRNQPGWRLWTTFVHGLDDESQPAIYYAAVWVPPTWLPGLIVELLDQVGRRPGRGEKTIRSLLRTWPHDLTHRQLVEAHVLLDRYGPLTVPGWLVHVGCIRSQLARLSPPQRALCDLLMDDPGEHLAAAIELAQLTLPV